MYPDPKKLDTPILDKAARDVVSKAVLEKCDALDGLKDGFMTDPRKCTFDVKTIQCKSGKKDDCLTQAQVEAVELIHKGPMLNGKPFHVGYPFGGEFNDAGWGTWLAGRKDAAGPGRPSLAYGFSGDFMRFFLKQDPNWNHQQLDLATLGPEMKYLQATLSPTNPDISAFRKSGGKLLMYHGWSDSALSPLMTLDWYDKVMAHDASAKADLRLFMMPGVMHCAGGPGPDRADYLDALDKWVTSGTAPEELPVGFAAGGGRKLCAWPKQAAYKGTGDGKSADQFECK
jgi:feruloyl esterase